MRELVQFVRRVITQPEEELNRWQLTVRTFIRFVRIAAVGLREDRAPQMAAALAYRTIFSLIPVLVIVMVALGTFYGPGAIEGPTERILDYMGLYDIAFDESELPRGDEDEALDPVAGIDPDETPASVAAWIEALVDRVAKLNFAAIGAAGALVLIYAALSLIIEIERAFNIIYRAPHGRRMISRLTNYWALLTLAPIGIITSFFVGERLSTAFEGAASMRLVSVVVTFVISWLLIALAYTVMPNTRVHKRPAMAGAFVAAGLWELGKWAFGQYLAFSTGYATLYGSLGLIPVFLLWVYVTWLVILFGLELAYALQMLYTREDSGLPREKRRGASFMDPAALVVYMRAVADRFNQGEVATTEDIARSLGLPEEAVDRMAGLLAEHGLLLRVEHGRERTGLALARPAESITIAEILNAARELSGSTTDDDAWKAIEQVWGERMSCMEGETLASLGNEKA